MSITITRPVRTCAVVFALVAGATLQGCATIGDESSYLTDVSAQVYNQTTYQPNWQSGLEDSGEIDRLLDRRLTARSAVQVALLNNRNLQAIYADLGLAHTDVIQAGLLTNPVLEGSAVWPYSPEATAANLAFGAAFNIVELFKRPTKEAVARHAFTAAKFRAAEAIVRHAASTNKAFVDVVAGQQKVSLLNKVVKSARAATETAATLREAGNITALEFEQQQSLLTSAKLRLAKANLDLAGARETLNERMGLTGAQTGWNTAGHLQPVPSINLPGDIEREAVMNNLDLKALAQDIVSLGYKHQLVNAASLIPDLELGGEWEREDGEKEAGVSGSIQIPLFDQGQAKRARSKLEIKRAQHRFWAKGVEVRSSARRLRQQLKSTQQLSIYHRDAILPQQQRLLAATQRQLNAMTTGVFALITAKRQEIDARIQQIDVHHQHWLAYLDLHQLLAGSLPETTTTSQPIITGSIGEPNTSGDH